MQQLFFIMWFDTSWLDIQHWSFHIQNRVLCSVDTHDRFQWDGERFVEMNKLMNLNLDSDVLISYMLVKIWERHQYIFLRELRVLLSLRHRISDKVQKPIDLFTYSMKSDWYINDSLLTGSFIMFWRYTSMIFLIIFHKYLMLFIHIKEPL